MLCCLQGNVQMLWRFLRWKYSEHSKKRMEQHFQDVAQKVANNKNLDSFAAHFGNFLPKNQVHKNVAKLCLSIYFLR